MSTFTQLLYHIVYSTKNREQTLSHGNRTRLYEYIWGILKNKKCHPYRINGIEDHIHIATHIHASIPLADLVKDIKLASSSMIKESSLFGHFQGWQDGYAGFTCSYRDNDKLIEYIKNQEEHHKIISFKEELMELLKEHGIEFEEKYLL
jgi:REP element-mobilizing transposase RayT